MNIIFICLWILLLILWASIVFFQILMIRHRNDGIKLFDSRLLFNPFNVQFFGKKYLTDKGLVYRNKSWIASGIFLITICLILIFGH